MKKHSTVFAVRAEHLDAGRHVNWNKHNEIAEEVHLAFRKEQGWGLDVLQEKHGMFFIMASASQRWRMQVRANESFSVYIVTWIAGPVRLGCKGFFYRDKTIITELNWEMALISESDGRPCKIPRWIRELIGEEMPEPPDLQLPATTG